MSSKRTANVMLRLTVAELALLDRRKPTGEERATFARQTLLKALKRKPAGLREAVAAVVWALADDLTPEDAMRVLPAFRRNRRVRKGVTR